jgi:hypothetical protein
MNTTEKHPELVSALGLARAAVSAAEQDHTALVSEHAAAAKAADDAAEAYATDPTESRGKAYTRADDAARLLKVRVTAAGKRLDATRAALQSAQSALDAALLADRQAAARAAMREMETRLGYARAAAEERRKIAARSQVANVAAPALEAVRQRANAAAEQSTGADELVASTARDLEAARDALASLSPDYAAELVQIRETEAAQVAEEHAAKLRDTRTAEAFTDALAAPLAALVSARKLVGEAIGAIEAACAEHAAAGGVHQRPRAIALMLARLAIMETPVLPAEECNDPSLDDWLQRYTARGDRDGMECTPRVAAIRRALMAIGVSRGSVDDETALSLLLAGRGAEIVTINEEQATAEVLRDLAAHTDGTRYPRDVMRSHPVSRAHAALRELRHWEQTGRCLTPERPAIARRTFHEGALVVLAALRDFASGPSEIQHQINTGGFAVVYLTPTREPSCSARIPVRYTDHRRNAADYFTEKGNPGRASGLARDFVCPLDLIPEMPRRDPAPNPPAPSTEAAAAVN